MTTNTNDAQLKKAQTAFTRDVFGNTSKPLTDQAADRQREAEAQQAALNNLSPRP